MGGSYNNIERVKNAHKGGHGYEAYRKAKKQVEKAETKEEKKSLIEDAGMELTDEELDMVAGGRNTRRSSLFT